MSNLLLDVLPFAILIILYRAAWARLALQGSRAWRNGYIVSFVLYAIAGAYAGTTFWSSSFAGAVLALVEVTVGVAVASRLGAYGDDAKTLLRRRGFAALMTVLQVLFGAMLGALGWGVGQVARFV